MPAVSREANPSSRALRLDGSPPADPGALVPKETGLVVVGEEKEVKGDGEDTPEVRANLRAS